MQVRIAYAALVPLLLAAGASGAAQPNGSRPDVARVQIAADDSSTDKTSYLDKAKGEMAEWRTKLGQAADDAKAKGHELTAKTKSELSEAWNKTEEAGRKLQDASSEGWDNAKDAYQRAAQNLKDTWDRAQQSGE